MNTDTHTNERPVLCCWCDAHATHNLDSYYDVACAEHYVLWFTPAGAAEVLALLLMGSDKVTR